MARQTTRGSEEEEKAENAEANPLLPDINITQKTDISGLDAILDNLDAKDYEERMQETKRLLEATEKGIDALEPTFQKLGALNQKLDGYLPFLTGEPSFEYMGVDHMETDQDETAGTQEHQGTCKKMKIFHPNEFVTESEKEFIIVISAGDSKIEKPDAHVERIATAMDLQIRVVTGYSEMDTTQAIELGRAHVLRIANEMGVTPDSVSETQ